MKTHEFNDRKVIGSGVTAESHPGIIARYLGDLCVEVNPRDSLDDDRRGTDYVARMAGGVQYRIDVKTRERGCSQFWKHGPELAIELWSVKPTADNPGQIGWCLDHTKQTDYTLHVYDPDDTTQAFFLPFLLLRMACWRRQAAWKARYDFRPQQSYDKLRKIWWESEVVFVPATIVIGAMNDEMKS